MNFLDQIQFHQIIDDVYKFGFDKLSLDELGDIQFKSKEKAKFLTLYLPQISYRGGESLAYCPRFLISTAIFVKPILLSLKEHSKYKIYFSRLQCLSALAALMYNNNELACWFVNDQPEPAIKPILKKTLPGNSLSEMKHKAYQLKWLLRHRSNVLPIGWTKNRVN